MEMLRVSNRDLVSSLVFSGLAVIFMVGALRYGFGSFSRPGPGLMPFFASIIVLVLSGIVFFISLSKRKERGGEKDQFLPDKGILIRQIVGVLSLFGYGIALEPLGFTLTTVLFMVVVLRFVGLKKNRKIFILATYIIVLYPKKEKWNSARIIAGKSQSSWLPTIRDFERCSAFPPSAVSPCSTFSLASEKYTSSARWRSFSQFFLILFPPKGFTRRETRYHWHG